MKTPLIVVIVMIVLTAMMVPGLSFGDDACPPTDTPIPPPTDTPVPSPTDTPVPPPTNTAEPTATVTLPPPPNTAEPTVTPTERPRKRKTAIPTRWPKTTYTPTSPPPDPTGTPPPPPRMPQTGGGIGAIEIVLIGVLLLVCGALVWKSAKDSGQDLAEYALLIGFIAVVIFIGIMVLGDNLRGFFDLLVSEVTAWGKG